MADDLSTITSYTQFDATNIRDLVIQRLNQGGIFTEQNYQGSNLSAVIDIVSLVFSTLLFQLNKTASESMFSEAQIYENMNRIVKLISYNPIGKQAGNVNFGYSVQSISAGSYCIPRYSYLRLGGTIFCSNEDIQFIKTADDTLEQITSNFQDLTLYQGQYYEYPLYTAVGSENEIIYLAVDDTIFIDHFNIDVYVKLSGTTSWVKWNRVEELFLSESSSQDYKVRYNSNKRYEIEFGNDINGKKLNSGDQVLVYYLSVDTVSDGIGPNSLRDSFFIRYNSNNFGSILEDTQFNVTNLSPAQLQNVKLDNTFPSNSYTKEESVDSIRTNAPKLFHTQYRLITSQDYDVYTRVNFSNIINDVKVLNNEEFLKDHIGYYYGIGLDDPQKENRILYSQVKFGTSCNFNNVYVYIVPKNKYQLYLNAAQKELINTTLDSNKILTSNVIIIDPVYLVFDFGIKSTVNDLHYTNSQNTKLRITKTLNNKRASSAIINDVVNIFSSYFTRENIQLGQYINISQLNSDVLNINGIDNIQTVYNNEVVEGISLAVWDNIYKNSINVYNQNFTLSNVQFPVFNNLDTLSDKIDVVESVGNISSGEF